MAFAVTGHLEGIDVLPVSWFMACQALRLECVKSTDFTVSVHLSLRTSSSFWRRAVADESLYSRVVAFWWSKSRQLHSLSQPGMYVLMKPRGGGTFLPHLQGSCSMLSAPHPRHQSLGPVGEQSFSLSQL